MPEAKERTRSRVLLVTDRTVSEDSLSVAAAFARALDGDLEHWMVAETAEEMRSLAPKLEEGETSLEERVPRVTAEMKKGLAAELLDSVDPDRYQLVVLRFGGRRGLKKVFPRSEVLSIVRRAETNVLVLWGREKPPRRFLFLVGGSPYAQQAVEFAAPLAARMGAEATVLHVAETEPKLYVEGAEPAPLDPGVQRALDRAVRTLARVEVPAETRVRYGRVVDEVLAEVAAADQDLIVVGSHGMGGIRPLLLGSVAKELVRQAHIPLLIVRARQQRPLWRRILGLRR